MFKAPLFTIAKKWKTANAYDLVNGQTKCGMAIPYDLAIERNKALIIATAWINLKTSC